MGMFQWLHPAISKGFVVMFFSTGKKERSQ